MWGTLAVNVSGAFALGVLVVWLEGERPHVLARPFLSVGLLGGWTTYSTFALDAHALGTDGPALLAGHLAATVLLGVGGAWLGLVLGDHLWGGDADADAVVVEDEL